MSPISDEIDQDWLDDVCDDAEQLPILETEIARLRRVNAELVEALRDARGYVESVVLNATGQQKRTNYRNCLGRIDAALRSATETKEHSDGR